MRGKTYDAYVNYKLGFVRYDLPFPHLDPPCPGPGLPHKGRFTPPPSHLSPVPFLRELLYVNRPTSGKKVSTFGKKNPDQPTAEHAAVIMAIATSNILLLYVTLLATAAVVTATVFLPRVDAENTIPCRYTGNISHS